ncbi:MAG: GbsR/MarR family transcriptional regulator [Flavobacteriales bacterium]
MKYEEAREQLINVWGSLGSSWGISATMARVHALLLLSEEPLHTDALIGELQISRGNANMSVRALIEWNLVRRVSVKGERREFFVAEKDLHKVALTIVRERRKREISPLIGALSEIRVDKDDDSPEAADLRKRIREIEAFVKDGDQLLERIIRMEESKLWHVLSRILK